MCVKFLSNMLACCTAYQISFAAFTKVNDVRVSADKPSMVQEIMVPWEFLPSLDWQMDST